MDGVVRVTRRASSAKNASSVNQRRTQKSTTLNRKFVKKVAPRPRINASAAAASRTLKGQSQPRVLIRRTQQVRLQPQPQQTIVQQAVETQAQAQQKFAQRAAAHSVSLKDIEAIQPAQDAPIVKVAKARMAARKAAAPQPLTAQELKERAIQQALRKVSTMDADEEYSEAFKKKHFWQKKKFALAASMAVVSLALLGYLVSVNMPNISVRVAAMHSGIEKAYPSYVPSSYRLDGLVKEENGRITMGFKDDNGKKFTLMEEKSSWDSSAVLSNYVIKNWGASYSIAKGQGLTIYVSGSNAAWVNGGVFYVINDNDNALTSSDLHDIAVSL
jgi:hypothetical protein